MAKKPTKKTKSKGGGKASAQLIKKSVKSAPPKSEKTSLPENEDQALIQSIMKQGGRPRSIDLTSEATLSQILLFGRLAATQQEMANWFMVARETINVYMSDKEGVFSQTYAKGLGDATSTLRLLQWTQAKKGNHKMQIWLGKQLLEQKEKVQHSGDEASPLAVKIVDDVPGEGD